MYNCLAEDNFLGDFFAVNVYASCFYWVLEERWLNILAAFPKNCYNNYSLMPVVYCPIKEGSVITIERGQSGE